MFLDTCREIKSEMIHDDFDDLKVIINDHQNVMKYVTFLLYLKCFMCWSYYEKVK